MNLLEFHRLSEGVMIKRLDGVYQHPQNKTWAKYKNQYEIDGIVLKRNQTKVPSVFNYDLGVGPISVEHAKAIGDKAQDFKNQHYMFIGRSDSTTFRLDEGEILRVAAEEVLWHKAEADFNYYTGYVMRVLEPVPEKHKPDPVLVMERIADLEPRRLPPVKKSLQTLKIPEFVWIPDFVSLAGSTIYASEGMTSREPHDIDLILRCEEDEKTGRFMITLDPSLRLKLDRVMELNIGDKPIQYTANPVGPNWDFLAIYDLVLRPKNPLAVKTIDESGFKDLLYKQEDPYMTVLDEGKTYRYGMQIHFRGKTAHVDLRFEDADKKELIGWTIACQMPSVISDPVETMSDAQKWFKNPDAWKIDFDKGRVRERRVRGGQVRPAQLFAARKSKEPMPWINVEGVVAPGKVGATRFEHGVFLPIDKGTIQTGTQKPYFHEYFVNGKLFQGRIAFRQLGHTEKLLKDEALLPHGVPMEAWRDPYFWSFIQPIDQRPYVLSEEAVEKGWMPPDKSSALPIEIKRSLPLAFRYWMEKGEKAKGIRDSLVRALASGKFKLDFDLILHGAKIEKAAYPYVLQWHYWKKVKVIREGPSSQHYDLRIDFDQGPPFHLVLERNPLEATDVSGYEKQEAGGRECMERGKDGPEFLKPSGDAKEGQEGFNPWNPTKDTPAYVERLDHGSVEVLEKNPNLLKIRFSGKLKGLWMIVREEAESKFWTMRRTQEAPAAKSDQVGLDAIK